MCISKHIIKDLICSNHDFDWQHKNLCDEIMRISEQGIIIGGMTYGQAQKWVNMTMKYMWLLGIWDEEFKRVIDKIHIPVDRYIIEAAKAWIEIAKSKKPQNDFKCIKTKRFF